MQLAPIRISKREKQPFTKEERPKAIRKSACSVSTAWEQEACKESHTKDIIKGGSSSTGTHLRARAYLCSRRGSSHGMDVKESILERKYTSFPQTPAAGSVRSRSRCSPHVGRT